MLSINQQNNDVLSENGRSENLPSENRPGGKNEACEKSLKAWKLFLFKGEKLMTASFGEHKRSHPEGWEPPA